MVDGVDLAAMPMALLDHVGPVGLRGQRAGLEVAGLRAQAHRRPHVGHVLLLGQQVDDRRARSRGRTREEFAPSRPQTLRANSMTAHCRPEADPEERDAALPREPHRVDLALHAAHPEPAGDQDAVHVGERRLGRLPAEVVGGDPVDAHVGAVVEAAVAQRLHRPTGRRRAGTRTCRRPRCRPGRSAACTRSTRAFHSRRSGSPSIRRCSASSRSRPSRCRTSGTS